MPDGAGRISLALSDYPDLGTVGGWVPVASSVGALVVAHVAQDCFVAILLACTHEGVPIDYLRIRGFPFGPEVQEFLDGHDEVFVVEQNRDGQFRSMLLLEMDASDEQLIPVLHYSGLPIDCGCIMAAINERLDRSEAA